MKASPPRRGLTGQHPSTRGPALVAMALMALWTAACGDGGTTAPIPNLAPLASGSISPRTVAAGETVAVNASDYFTDPDGDALTFTATSSNATSASVAVSGGVVTVTAVAAGVANVTVTARALDGLSAQQSFTVTVQNRAPVARDSIPEQTLFMGDTASVNMAAYFHDPDGDALSYSVANSDEAVASASVSGSLVSLKAATRGTSTVTVTARDPGGLSARQDFAVTVPNREPIALDSIPSQILFVDQTVELDLSSYFDDLDGDALSYAAGSSNGAVVLAVVSGGGFAMLAMSAGTALVTVTANDPGGLCAHLSFQVTVEAQAPVAITGIDPSVLIEGASATITGSGFEANAGLNQVTIGGLPATVTSASTTRLSITVPWSDCLPPRREELRVAVGSKSDVRTVAVAPLSAEDMELDPGWYRVTHAGNGCLQLPGDASGGEFLIGVASTSENPARVTGVTLTGTPGDATVVAAAASGTVVAMARPQQDVVTGGLELGQFALRRTTRGPGSSAPAFDQAADPVRRDWERHGEIMAESEALIRRLGTPGPIPPTMLARSTTAAAADTFAFYAGGHSCTDRSIVRAVVRYVGNHAIWLDDVENPSASFTEQEFAELDGFYASDIRPVHDGYFGQLTDIDDLGRIVILMTKEVNREDDVDAGSFTGGWVWPGDLYAKSQCMTSNQGEIFYGRVPDPDGVFGDQWTKQRTLDYYPSLMAHEITHLIQFGYSAHGSARYNSWELEGGATLAEQLVAYRLFGHGSGQDLGWNAYNTSDESRSWYWDWIGDIARFLGWDSDGDGTGRVRYAPEQCTWIGQPDEGNTGPCKAPFRAVYGVPSMVYRYAMDRWGDEYPGGETAMMTRFTQSAHEGFASLEDISAWRIEQILADFYMTLWGDLNGYNMYGMASWNLHDGVAPLIRTPFHLGQPRR